MSEPIFPILRDNAPFIEKLRQKLNFSPKLAKELTPAQKRMAEEFRIGMAEALGVSPERIRNDVVSKWIINWTRAFVKPEHWVQKGYMRQLGKDIVAMVGLRPQAQDASPSGEKIVRSRRSDERRERYERASVIPFE